VRRDWVKSTLAETCEMYQPKTISAKEMTSDGPYPVYGANGIIGRYSQFNHAEPQLLITCRGATCGSVNISQPKSWITGNAMVVCPKTESLNIRLLEYLFRGGLDITAAITGAAQPQITRTNLNPIEICFPDSVTEQKRIVAILDEVFEGIDAAIANAEKNLANARELFDSYLNSVFARKRKGWVERKLSDICSIESKLVDPREAPFIDLPHLGAGNMISKTGEIVEVRTAREEGLISGKFLFNENTVLYSKIRPYLMKACRPKFSGLCSADVYPLVADKAQMDRNLLFYMLMSRDFTDYAVSGSGRAGMPKVNRDHLFRYSVWLPRVEEQARLAARLDMISGEALRLESVYERKLTSLVELKQTILQKAFAGALPARFAEAVPEAAE
jgi:type I restriction enzyme S subunit